ncbi:MAG: hypothetical protein A3F99_00740 [Candidatus Colwellbacteria bacterium RIFCSPLOWO2_12_FULL_43_11]|uniref:SD-repeat containing protein B domain-containing protein n=1 Tax=Candidatus Colwellbacteria bacterium RIFCSPLOWO2_12_FULL_43_11 TaxID=1797693 RepID=A0A1G1Z956_9BACT|nr:MAG: hypothetical protein A3F99_00740 [Candidatus Colwellbacteria bacterium RIFCSPLOWO2_12_FULL_43_11]
MHIEWNKVTWYSKLLAVVLFVGTFFLGFYLGWLNGLSSLPINNTSVSAVNGLVLLGPTCPVVKDPPEEQCADKPYKTNLALTTNDGARVIKEFSSDENGRFIVEAPPGEYSIRSAVASNIWPYCSSNETIKLEAGSSVETTVSCDTGIR